MENNYLPAFYFELVYKGEKIAFREIAGIAVALNVEEVVNGGENRFKYKLPTIPTYQNLVCKRAIVPQNSKLLEWCTDTISHGLINKIETNTIAVHLLDADGLVALHCTFYNAYPVKYSLSDLHSMENALVIETIELAYNYFEILPAVK